MFASNKTSKMNTFCRFTFISIRQTTILHWLFDEMLQFSGATSRVTKSVLRRKLGEMRCDVRAGFVGRAAQLTATLSHLSSRAACAWCIVSMSGGGAVHCTPLLQSKHSTRLIEFLIGVRTRTWAVPVPPVGNCGESIFCLVMAVSIQNYFSCLVGGGAPEGLEVCNIPQGKGGGV